MRLLRLVPKTPNIPFMRWHRLCLALSVAAILGSAALLLTIGINFGIDFRGGTLIEVRAPGEADLGAMRNELNGLGLGDVSLQAFGTESDVLIRIPPQADVDTDVEQQEALVDTVSSALKARWAAIEIRRVEYVGPVVSGELVQNGIIAVLVSIAFMMIYVWLRFEWQFGLGSVLALLHDVMTTVGLFCITQMVFDLPVIAALLTIVGYSMNDTVVVYDRIRENLRKYKQENMPDLIDRSLNETLSRTVMTGMTTLLALAALYVFGGEVIAPFVLAMIWGVVIGTYSSIFIAAPFLIYLKPIRRSAADEAAESPAGAARP